MYSYNIYSKLVKDEKKSYQTKNAFKTYTKTYNLTSHQTVAMGLLKPYYNQSLKPLEEEEKINACSVIIYIVRG